MKKISTYVFICILFCFLLLFPGQTLDASKYGLLLWFDSLLPALLPFLIISQLILTTSLVDEFQKITGPVFQKIFHCSSQSAFCILCGFLCGYPVGARLIAVQLQEKRITLKEGQYLLAFCNNVSPMFCISYGITYAIGANNWIPFLCCIYGSALLFGIITRPHRQSNNYEEKKQTSSTENIFQLIDVCIIDSFLIMIKLCGYLIIFSIIHRGIFMLLPASLPYAEPLLGCILEITGGLSKLSALPVGMIRSLIGTAALTFGGLCCIFQTNSVINDTGLSLKKYIFHKILITILALCFFFLWEFFSNFFTINRWC